MRIKTWERVRRGGDKKEMGEGETIRRRGLRKGEDKDTRKREGDKKEMGEGEDIRRRGLRKGEGNDKGKRKKGGARRRWVRERT